MDFKFNVIKVGSRRSQLALAQTHLTVELLKESNPDLKFEVVKISTIGDRIIDVALSKIGDKNLFTKELEVALLDKTVDFVVHSLKDVPTITPEGLVLGCIYNRMSTDDVVLMSPSNRGKMLRDLPFDSIIGTSAVRRVAILSRQYPKLKFLSIRGNLNTRIKKLDEPQTDDVHYDAIILAKAGVDRLGLSNRIDEILSDSHYAVGQGALTCECREDDKYMLKLLSGIHEESAALSTIAERSFMRTLEGGCTTPIGVRSVILPELGTRPYTLKLSANVLSLDGTKCVEGALSTRLPYQVSKSKPIHKKASNNQSTDEMIPFHSHEDEIKLAMKQDSLFLGLTIRPCCSIARLRMARAQRLGSLLAEKLLSMGANEILDEIHLANAPSKFDCVD